MNLTMPEPTAEPPPTLELIKQDNGQYCAVLAGHWNLQGILKPGDLAQNIKQATLAKPSHWDMRAVEVLDSIAALTLWQAWGEKMPENLTLKPQHQALFARWQAQQLPSPAPAIPLSEQWLQMGHHFFADFWQPSLTLIALLGQLLLDFAYLLRYPSRMPWAEISIAIYDAGVRALGITALVGFLIGIVLSYLSALQLKMFGAEIFIINILGVSIIREIGPLLAAILVAGRSGSAITAQIGIMRVTEELDALSAMGISHSLRLIVPKVVALTVVLPLLSVWTNSAALLGGMVAAATRLDISFRQFFVKLPDAVPLANLLIGFGKSAVFGLMIALVACHFGFRCKPNTESLGNETTNSVVAAITGVMMIDAVFAIVFMGVGMP
jgi:phospholipid/cholesterol/gamma-HCH transport system permease protein